MPRRRVGMRPARPTAVGFLPAKWSVEALDEQAVENQDVKFAGGVQA